MKFFKKKKKLDIKGEIYAFRILIDNNAKQSKLEEALSDLLKILKNSPVKILVEQCPFYQSKDSSKHDQKLMLTLLKSPVKNCPFCNYLVFPEENPILSITQKET